MPIFSWIEKQRDSAVSLLVFADHCAGRDRKSSYCLIVRKDCIYKSVFLPVFCSDCDDAQSNRRVSTIQVHLIVPIIQIN
jgi:hypothetical protein